MTLTQQREERGETTMMRAITWQGKKSVTVADVPKPCILDDADVIVKVTASTICSGSDSHLYGGEIPMETDAILGHEACGIVQEKGPAVQNFNVGDRVVIAFDIACGQCAFCQRGEFTGCDRTNTSVESVEKFGHRLPAIFGYGKLLGNVPGSQAQFVRVPIADVNMLHIPDHVPDEKALFVSDVLSTSLHAVCLGEVGKGDTVVIWGLGPIGLFAGRWAQIKGASRVIGIDSIPERLQLAKKLGMETFDRTKMSTEDVVSKLQMLVPGGADVVIEAVGFRFPITKTHQMKRAVGMKTDTADILTECFNVVRPWGRVSIIADYIGFADQFPIGHMVMKHLTVRGGQCPVQRYWHEVMEALDSGVIDPTPMVTHHGSLEEGPKFYEMLFKKEAGCIKVIMRP